MTEGRLTQAALLAVAVPPKKGKADLRTNQMAKQEAVQRHCGCDTRITWFWEQSLENITPWWRTEMLTIPP